MERDFSLCMLWILVSWIFSYLYARRNNHLDCLGAFFAFISLAIHFSSGFRYGMMLLMYLLISFWLKRNRAETNERRAPMSWKKVFIHGTIPAIWALMLLKFRGWEDKCVDSDEESRHITSIVGLILGHYSFIVADNWSSDRGLLNEGEPTNSQEVVRRTLAVFTDWFLRTAKGGVFIALTFVLFGHLMVKCSSVDVQWDQWLIPLVTASFGLYGRLIQILLGMWLPFRGWCVRRRMVVWEPGLTVLKISGVEIFDKNSANIISMLLTAALTARVLVSFM